MSALIVPTTADKIKNIYKNNSVIPIVQEMMRIFPEGIVITSGVYALLTLSFPFAVFFGSMVEASLLLILIRETMSYIGMSPMFALSKSGTRLCRPGFADMAPTLQTLTTFASDPIKNPFPSPPIFMLSVASAYLFSTLNAQSKELESLGPAYSSRYYVSAIFLTTLLFVFVSFRIAFGCETFGTVMMSIPIGLILGMLLVQQNTRLFGPASINLSGISLLANKTASGGPIYICPK